MLDTWREILADIKEKERLRPEEVENYLGNVQLEEERPGRFVLLTPTLFHKDWIEKRYRDVIRKQLESRLRRPIELEVWLLQEKGGALRRGRKNRAAVAVAPRSGEPGSLNTKYTFDAFVVGSSNQFAHAAAIAVAESPGRAYNPLFLYGGVGLGKTHLMQSIGERIRERRPGSSVLYTSAEQFTNEFINALKDKRMDVFQKKFRAVDVLLLDDIQFLARAERSREEFFHTFNELYESKRQLVITSDRAPREIPLLEDRLRSRLEWGLIADVKPPDLELRIAILRKKSEEVGHRIDDDCLQYIATRIRSNSRELEGPLQRVVAMGSLTGKSISMEITQEALKDFVARRFDGQFTFDQILTATGNYFNLSPHDLKSKRRSSHIAYARHIAVYLTRELIQASFPVIATEFGGRDHTTALYSYTKVCDLMESDRKTQTVVEEIRRTLGEN